MNDSITSIGDAGFLARARDVEIRLCEGLLPPPSRETRVYLFKDPGFLDALCKTIDPLAPKSIVELGAYDGGSAIYWEHRYQPTRLAIFELAARVPHLQSYIERHRLADTMRLHLETSQDDRPALAAALATDFGGLLLDLVLDDASHMLAQTRRSFEILFPHVRPGGFYIIEDWAWGHSQSWPAGFWSDMPLMSPLISEIMLVCGRDAGVVERMEIHPKFATIVRGAADLPTDGSFDLTQHYVTRAGSP